jgi:hypothetical protein
VTTVHQMLLPYVRVWKCAWCGKLILPAQRRTAILVTGNVSGKGAMRPFKVRAVAGFFDRATPVLALHRGCHSRRPRHPHGTRRLGGQP